MCAVIGWKSMLYQSIEYADVTTVRYEKKVCFENWK